MYVCVCVCTAHAMDYCRRSFARFHICSFLFCFVSSFSFNFALLRFVLAFFLFSRWGEWWIPEPVVQLKSQSDLRIYILCFIARAHMHAWSISSSNNSTRHSAHNICSISLWFCSWKITVIDFISLSFSPSRTISIYSYAWM